MEEQYEFLEISKRAILRLQKAEKKGRGVRFSAEEVRCLCLSSLGEDFGEEE